MNRKMLMVTALTTWIFIPAVSHAASYESQSDDTYQTLKDSNSVSKKVMQYNNSGGTTIDQDYEKAGGNPSGNSNNSNNSNNSGNSENSNNEGNSGGDQ